MVVDSSSLVVVALVSPAVGADPRVVRAPRGDEAGAGRGGHGFGHAPGSPGRQVCVPALLETESGVLLEGAPSRQTVIAGAAAHGATPGTRVIAYQMSHTNVPDCMAQPGTSR